MAMLTTEQLSIGYQQALAPPFDLALRGGELIALLGVNGIGKSTLLRTLAGLQDPLGGRVLLNGGHLHRLPMGERARQVAVVLTQRAAPPFMDIRTLVGLGRQPWTGRFGRMLPADLDMVNKAMERTGLRSLASRALDRCSDGERQKAFIARALAQDTPVLLLDEPTAYLDLPNRAAIVRSLRTVAHADGRVVLFSTHDVQLAMDLCDRLVLLRSGAVPWCGTPAQALEGRRLQESFAGSGIQFDLSTGTHRYMP